VINLKTAGDWPFGATYFSQPRRPGDRMRKVRSLSPGQLTNVIEVRSGSCVTRIAGPNGDAQLYER
jgi:hypothetical protein